MNFFSRSGVWRPVVIVLAVIAVVWGASMLISSRVTHSLAETAPSDTKQFAECDVTIYEIQGTADAEYDGKVYGAYADMQLLDDDELRTYVDSYLKLKIDDNKYIMLEENTSAAICADGKKKKDQTELTLTEGTVVVRIGDPFTDDAYFGIVTPNASIEVKNGIYRIDTGTDESGSVYTEIDVCGGTADISVIRLDGTKVSEGYTAASGTRSVVSGVGDSGVVKTDGKRLDYSDYSLVTLTFLDEMLQHGDSISIESSELAEKIRISQLPYYTVTFMYDGKEFGKQTVRAEDTAQVPSLKPAQKGKWDFDFSEPITDDVEIEWIEEDANTEQE